MQHWLRPWQRTGDERKRLPPLVVGNKKSEKPKRHSSVLSSTLSLTPCKIKNSAVWDVSFCAFSS
jgi:hypothetical protein